MAEQRNLTNDSTLAYLLNKAKGAEHTIYPATAAPKVDGTAAVGASDKYAREDHVHPTDTALLNLVYPVGAIYMSVNSTSPASLFGGTWARITGAFLLAATDGGSSGASQAAGNTGGAATVTLTEQNMPSHNHSIPALSGTAKSNGNHIHAMRYKAPSGGSSGYAWVYGTNNAVWAAATESDSMMKSTGAHTHTVETTANTSGSKGSGTAHNNMPPYLSVYVWKRTA